MKTMSDRYSAADEESLFWNLFRGAIGFLWFVIRVPIGIVLAFLEPFVRFALFGIAVAGWVRSCVVPIPWRRIVTSSRSSTAAQESQPPDSPKKLRNSGRAGIAT